jgi:hypothetical protein
MKVQSQQIIPDIAIVKNIFDLIVANASEQNVMNHFHFTFFFSFTDKSLAPLSWKNNVMAIKV